MMKTIQSGATRHDREAEALRTNLARRKAQARSRAPKPEVKPPEPASHATPPSQVAEEKPTCP
jgi:hypothetical protein